MKKILKLEGLTCASCETRIENKLNKLNGVVKTDVSYVTSILYVTYDTSIITLDVIVKTIEKLDYSVIQDTPAVKSETVNKSINQFIIMGIIVFGFYLIIKNTIGFNFIPEITPNMGYGILFVVGLVSSLHCIAMCGGINLSLCVSYKFDKEDNSKFSKFIPSFLYNLGRVISYTIIGGIVGALGSVISISISGRATVAIIAGAFMIIMGLNMMNIFPWLRKLNPRIPKLFARKINSTKKDKGPFVVGLLNGLMPCGPLQAMQIYALGTGSFLTGALSMFMFSLGTVPLLFGFGLLGSLLSSKLTKKMIKVSAMLVIILGLVMINRGFTITGFTLHSFAANTKSNNTTSNSANISTSENGATVNGDVQEIVTTLESGSYPPITVQDGVPVKWTIVADANNLNGCNSEIVIPQFNIEQKLVAGDNVITFTPTKTGTFGYSCWMGMIRSTITVVADTENTEESIDTEIAPTVDNSGLPAGCCGN